MADITTKVVVTREDGSNFYRQEHGFYGLSDESAAALHDAMDKHSQWVKKLVADQKKEAGEVFSAVIEATGFETLTFTGFNFDTFEKACREWNKLGDQLTKALEKSIKKA